MKLNGSNPQGGGAMEALLFGSLVYLKIPSLFQKE